MIFGGTYMLKELIPPNKVVWCYVGRMAIFYFVLIFYFTAYPYIMTAFGWSKPDRDLFLKWTEEDQKNKEKSDDKLGERYFEKSEDHIDDNKENAEIKN